MKPRGGAIAGAGAAAAQPTGLAEQPHKRKRNGRSQKQQHCTEEQPSDKAATGSESSAEAGSKVPRHGKRQRKQVVLPLPAALCFSSAQTAVRIGTCGYR